MECVQLDRTSSTEDVDCHNLKENLKALEQQLGATLVGVVHGIGPQKCAALQSWHAQAEGGCERRQERSTNTSVSLQ